MCAILQISGNCFLLTIQSNSSTISFKMNLKTKINLIGDIPSTELVSDLHLLNSLRISNCQTKISDKHIPGKTLSLGTFNGPLIILYTDARKHTGIFV